MESKSRAVGWDRFVWSSVAAAVVLLQILFSSPAKDGNAAKKPWLCWDTASLDSCQAFQMALHPHSAELGNQRKKYSLVCKPCSPGWALGLPCEQRQGSFCPFQMLNSDTGWGDTIWESLESQLWLHVYMSETLSCSKAIYPMPCSHSLPSRIEGDSELNMHTYLCYIISALREVVRWLFVAWIQCLGTRMWKHISSKRTYSTEIVLYQISSKGVIYRSDLMPTGARKKIPL